MKLQFGFARVVPVLVLLLAPQVPAQTEPRAKDKDLPHFHQVNAHLYRGAQPTVGGIKKLVTLGVKTIVNLRGDGKLEEDEAKAAQDAGIKYLSVPMPGYGRPKDEQVETVLSIINDPQNWPVFIHCKHGEDRTGVIIACFRISNEGKTVKEVLSEAKRYGMSRFQFGMKDFIGDYYKRKVLVAPQSGLRRVRDELNLPRLFRAAFAIESGFVKLSHGIARSSTSVLIVSPALTV